MSTPSAPVDFLWQLLPILSIRPHIIRIKQAAKMLLSLFFQCFQGTFSASSYSALHRPFSHTWDKANSQAPFPHRNSLYKTGTHSLYRFIKEFSVYYNRKHHTFWHILDVLFPDLQFLFSVLLNSLPSAGPFGHAAVVF